AAALERLIEAGRTLDGERARLAQQGAVYLAHWEELTHLLPAAWAEGAPLAPLPDAPAVGVAGVDVYTTRAQTDPCTSEPSPPSPSPARAPRTRACPGRPPLSSPAGPERAWASDGRAKEGRCLCSSVAT